MRVLFCTILFYLASACCVGQVVWSNFGGPEGTSVGAAGFFRALDGRWGLNVFEPNTPIGYPNRIVLFDDDGAWEAFPSWQNPAWWHVTYWIYPDQEQQRYLLVAGANTYDYEFLGTVYLLTDANFTVQEYNFTQTTLNTTRGTGDQIRTEGGTIVLVAGLLSDGEEYASSFQFSATSAMGDSLTTVVFENGLYRPRNICQTADGYAVYFDYAVGLGPEGVSKILYFDQGFNYVAGFGVTDLNGQQPVAGMDSVPLFSDMLILPNGDIIVASAFMAMVTGKITPVLMKYSAEGVLLDVRYGLPPERGSEYDSSPMLQLSDGNILWPFQEINQTVGLAGNHFLKVDPDLNVLGSIYIENYVDSIRIGIGEVVETDDGNLLVAGYKRTGPGLLTGGSYVAKIGGFSTSVPENSGKPIASVYPNPGSSFTLDLNTGYQSGTTLEVVDARGRSVHHSTLMGVLTQVDATAWCCGIYHYRAVAPDGNVVGAGKWVRE